MSQSVINPMEYNCENPQDKSTKAKSIIQLDQYELHQSFFTKQQLLAQPQFKVVKFENHFDSLQPILHGGFGNDVLYMGGMHMGLYHGWGILISKTTVYEGRFSLGHKMGKGYMKFANNSVYVGDFTNDKPHGQGMMQLQNEYYIGDFQNGAMQGDGLWRNQKQQKYVGSWKNNKAHGYGIYQTQKSHYQGQFMNFIKHGYGVENFPNRDFYKGYYIHGKPHGKGQYHWASGAIYIGEFAGGLRQGEGVWTGENGDKYIGNFSNDRKNGPGEYYWENGNIYKGIFCQDMRQGEGQMAWADGSVYNGQWQRGLPHGKGVFKVKGQKPRVGFFEDNVLVKQSRHKQSKSNQKLSTNFHKDSLILSMIPEVKSKSKKRKFMRSQKKQASRNSMLPSQTMSFMNSTTKARGWRSRNQKR